MLVRLGIAFVALATACIPYDDKAQRGRAVAPQPSPTRTDAPPREAVADTSSIDPPEDACDALARCCDALEPHARAYCRRDVEEADALSCALSYHWNECPDEPPDVAAGATCFRTEVYWPRIECHDSLIAACRAAGCATERGVHGCLVSDDDRRHVFCGSW